VHKTRNSRIGVAAFGLLAAPLLVSSTGLTSNLDARILAAHNREREQAELPSLRWNDALATSAQAWADHLAATGGFDHAPASARGGGHEGENLWAGTRGYYPAEAMVGLWIAEKRDYRPGPFPHNSRTGDIADVGHYTQLMWRRTSEVGCGLARGREEDVLVCRYSRAGNVYGEQPF